MIFNDLNMNDNLPEYNNLIGTLKGNVQFAQSHIIPSKPSQATGQYWAHLVSLRDTLVLFKPLGIENVDSTADVLLEVSDKDGNIIEWSKTNKKMVLPNDLPKPTEQIDVTEIDERHFQEFVSNKVYDKTIHGTGRFEGDEKGNDISSLLRDVKNGNALKLKSSYVQGGFTKNIYLPNDDEKLNGKFITFVSDILYGVVLYIHYKHLDDELRISVLWKDTPLHFMNVNGKWIEYSDLAYRRIRYGNNFWSMKLPSNVIRPEISMKFTFDGMSGNLDNLAIGAPNELLINTIDIGLLTPYRDELEFQKDPKWHSQYFQTVPVSRLIVNQYEPITLEKVVLRDGTIHTMDKGSNDRGDKYTGDMRRVGDLISMGINNANYGIHSTSSGDSWRNTPFACAQMSVNNMIGKYRAKKGGTELVIHGLTGGGGTADLFQSIGNEFSHELAHSYGKPSGLPNYNDLDPTGLFATQTLHRPANEKESTWGWDSIKNVFIPNFKKVATGDEICYEYTIGRDEKDKKCQLPFNEMYMFGRDAMGGGEPFYPSTNFFTMHTPYTSSRAQEFFEWKAVFDDTSKTGMRRWFPKCNCMAAWKSDEDVGDDDASKDYPRQPMVQGVAVTTLLGFYDPQDIDPMESYIYPALHSAYGNAFEQNSQKNVEKSKCIAVVINHEGKIKKYVLKGERQNKKWMNKFHINVEEDFQPKTITIKCRGENIASREISRPSKKLIYTVNGNGLYFFFISVLSRCNVSFGYQKYPSNTNNFNI